MIQEHSGKVDLYEKITPMHEVMTMNVIMYHVRWHPFDFMSPYGRVRAREGVD